MPFKEEATQAHNELTQESIAAQLAKVKCIFQQRAIVTAMGLNPDDHVELPQCATCGDHHEEDEIPYTCQTGDGV